MVLASQNLGTYYLYIIYNCDKDIKSLQSLISTRKKEAKLKLKLVALRHVKPNMWPKSHNMLMIQLSTWIFEDNHWHLIRVCLRVTIIRHLFV